MRTSSPLTSRITSSVLAVALVCWLVGAGSRDCCAKGSTDSSAKPAPTSQHALTDEAESGAEPHCGQPEHCRKKESAQPQIYLADADAPCAAHPQLMEAMPCCSLLGQAFDGARKVRVVPERLATALENAQPQPRFVSSSSATLGGNSFQRNLSGTYLRACVFLI